MREAFAQSGTGDRGVLLRAGRLVLLLSVLMAEALVLLALAPQLPPPLLRLIMGPGPEVTDSAGALHTESDPKVGARLPIPTAFSVATEKKAAELRGWKVILVVGSCYSCGGGDTKLWAEAMAQFGVPLFVITSDSAEKVHAYMDEYGIECHPVLDRDQALTRKLNARRTPRSYVIDGKGVLRYLQPATLSSQQALIEVTELIPRSGNKAR